MHRWLSPLVAILFLTAAPALAAPCKTQGAVDAPIAFPRNDAGDVPFARSMVAVMLPDISGALPKSLTCIRSTMSTALGDYAIGGENDDAFPRMALRADGKVGPVAYLAASRDAAGVFALVVHEGSLSTIKRFYPGIPTDQRLADDVRAALGDKTGIMSFDAVRKMVSYSFVPPGGVPPATLQQLADGTGVAAGPQILIESSGDPRLLDMADGKRHTPSGFACPETFDSLPVLLTSIDPRTDTLSCSYRAGTELRFREDDPIRYQITLIKASPGETPRGIFDELAASARASLHIKGEHAPPLAVGSSPSPEFVAYWDTEDAGVQGVWVGRAGGWIIWLRAQYPPSPANDVEAGKVAQTLFSLAGKQVR